MPEGNDLDSGEHHNRDVPEKYSKKRMQMEYKIIKLREMFDLAKKALPYFTSIFVVVLVAIVSKESLPYALAFLSYLLRLLNKGSNS